MPLKLFGFQLDIKAQINKSLFEVVQNDIGGNVLYIKLIDEGKPYSLVGASNVTFTALKEDNTFSVLTATIEDALNGKISVILTDQCIVLPGVVRATVQVYTETTRVTSAQFCYDVKGDISVGADPSSETEYPILGQLILDVSALETNVETAEALRVTAETGRSDAEALRVTSETGRVNAEALRSTAETNRNTAETGRGNAETARASAETTRGTNETGRVNAETLRVTAETNRDNAEDARILNEAGRVTAEGNRDTSEDARVLAENGRSTAEAGRVTAETARDNAEDARVLAESGRSDAETLREVAEGLRQTTFETNETDRQADFTAAETGRQTTFNNSEASRTSTFNTSETNRQNTFDTNETARGNAESGRVSAEVSRANAETARQTGYNAMIQESYVVFKAAVANYAAIAATYPNPQNSWVVKTLDDNKVYRYNGSAWIHWDTITASAYDAIVAQISSSNKSTAVETTDSIISLPSTAMKGMLEAVAKGRTYTNLIGTKGKGDSLTGWTGGASWNITDGCFYNNNPASYTYRYIDIPVELNAYYFVRANSLILTNAGIRCNYGQDTSTPSYGSSIAAITTKGIKLQATLGTTLRILVYCSAGGEAKVKEIMPIKITTEDNALTVDQLASKYPYINDTQSSKAFRAKSVGKNLCKYPLGKIFNMPAGSAKSSDAIPVRLTGDTITFKLIDKDGNGITTSNISVNFYDKDKVALSSYAGASPSPRTITLSTITYPCDWRKVRYIILNCNSSLPSPIDIANVVICNGATLYNEPYTETPSYFDWLNGEGKSVPNGVADEFDFAKGQYTKRVSDWVTLDGSKAWIAGADNTGYKEFKLTSGFADAYAAQQSSQVYGSIRTLKYNGLPLKEALSAPTEEVAIIFYSNDTLYLNVSDTETGMPEVFIATVNEIKAYFYGWKMCKSDGLAYATTIIPYTSSTWAEWSKTPSGQVVFDSTGATITALTGTAVHIDRDTTGMGGLKPNTKYGVIYNVVSSDLDSTFYIDGNNGRKLGGGIIALSRTVGNQKTTWSTDAVVTDNWLLMVVASGNTTGKTIKFKNLLLFELPANSQIDSDFTNLTADQLVTKYGTITNNTKYWKSIVDGSGLTSTLPTTLAAGYTPYKMIYQLANPIPTEIEGIEQIIAESSGTIFIEPFVKFTGIVANGVLTIPNTALTIKSIESLRKITLVGDDPKLEDIAVSSNTTTTITPTGAVNGDKYEVVYEYNSELTAGTSFKYSYPFNIKGQVEANTKAFEQMQDSVSKMDDFTVAYLIYLEARLVLQEARKATTQADSVAADVAGLVTDFNALLAKLKAANLMA